MAISEKAKRGAHLLHGNTEDGVFANYDFTAWASTLSDSLKLTGLDYNGDTVNESVKSIIDAVNLSLSSYDARSTISLLPLRLETKFIEGDLWIRIFPDQVFVKSHKVSLSQLEYQDGIEYWTAYYNAAGDLEKQKEAWRRLCTKYETTRAAWIIRSLFPTNIILNDAQLPNQAEIVGRLDSIIEEIDAEVGNLVGPKDIVSEMEAARDAIDKAGVDIVDNAKNIFTTGEVIGLNNANNQRRLKSHYNTFVNPILSEDKQPRRDDFLVKPYLMLKRSHELVDVGINKKKLGKNRSSLDSLKQGLYIFTPSRTKKNSILDFSNKFKNDLNNELSKWTNLSSQGYESFLLCNDLYRLKAASLTEQDRFNPIQANGRRIDASAELEIASAVGLIDSFINNWKSQIYFNNESTWFSISNLLERNRNVFKKVDFDKLSADLVALFNGLNTNNSGFPSTIKDYSNVLAFVSEKFREFGNISLKALSFDSNASNSAINALNGFQKAIQNLFVNYANAGLTEHPFSNLLSGFLDRLSLSWTNSVAWMSDALTGLSQIESNIRFIDGRKDYSFVQLAYGMSYHLLVNRYYLQINPLQDHGNLYSYQDESLERDFRTLEGTFVSGLKKVFVSESDVVSVINTLESTKKGFLELELGYSLPTEASNKIKGWHTSLLDEVASLADKRISADRIEYLRERSEELIAKLEWEYVGHFCQVAEAAGRLGHQTNPMVGNSAFLFTSYLEALTEGKDELEVINNDNSGDGFSFEFQGNGPTFPNVTIEGTASSIQQHSDILPTRFIAIGLSDSDSGTPGDYQSNIKFVWPGKKVNQSVKFGFDPNGDEDSFTFEINEFGEIEAHPDARWMIDKDWAERSGLAIKIPLASSENYFSRILVIGINETDTSIESHSSKWRDLFESHQYTSGIELLPIDSATNNSDLRQSAYSSDEGLHDVSFKVFAEAPLISAVGASYEFKMSDGQRTAEMLGLPYSSFFHVKGANNKSITNGVLGQRTTFPGTIGAHMEEALDSILNRDNRERIEEYFSKFVSARGHVPALRIGKQPYGIVLTGYLHGYKTDESNFISLSDFNYYDPNFQPYLSNTHPLHDFDVIVPRNILPNDSAFRNSIKARFDVRQIQVFKALDIEWRRFAEKFGRNVYTRNVDFHAQQYADLRYLLESPSAGGTINVPSDYGQIHFNDILTLSPYSTKYISRFVYSTASFKFIGGALQDPVNLGSVAPSITQSIGQNQELSALPYLAALTQVNAQNSMVVNNDQRVADFLVGANIERGVYLDFSRSVWSELDPLVYNVTGNTNPLHSRIQGARVFKTTNAREFIALNGGLLNNLGEVSSPQSYLNWLRTSHPSTIFANNELSSLPSKAVAFQLFRNAILYKYREAAAKLLLKEGLITDSQYNGLGSPERAIHHWTTVNEFISDFISSSSEFPENFQDYTSFFTKWDLLLTKFYRVHPYVLSDIENVIFADGLSSSNNRGNIEFNLCGIQDIHVPWRDSKLLKHLIPSFDNSYGIFDIADNFDTNHRTVADYLFGNDNIAQANELNVVKNKLKQYISTLEHIESFEECEIQRILAEAVDLSTHRIDAWIQGLFAKRLHEIRRRRTSKFGGQVFDEGTYVGAYGYVENLFRNAPDDSDSDATNASGNMPSAFIPAHSISHAVTAAILYNGYYINKIQKQNSVRNRSSVNLSSKRIRKALSILKGVRAGSQLGMILGQEFERGLIDSAVYIPNSNPNSNPNPNLLLDIYVYRLRKRFPLRGSNGELIESTQPQSGEYLDGLALLDHISNKLVLELNGQNTIFQVLSDFIENHSSSTVQTKLLALDLTNELDLPLPLALSEQKQAELKIIAFYLNEMAETLDALSDLMISEGVFQIVNGNTVRAAASLDLFSNAGIVEPDIINSPQKLNYFQNRMVVNYPTTGTSSWSLVSSPRRAVDLALNSWLVDLAGLSNVFAVSYRYSEGGEQFTTQYLFSDLGLEPIDILALVNHITQDANDELNRYITHKIKRDFPLRREIQLIWTEEVIEGQTPASEFIRMLSIVKEMLLVSNGLKPSDFGSTVDDDTVGFDVVEFKNKVQTSRSALIAYRLELESLPDSTSNLFVDSSMILLEKGVQFGLNGLLGQFGDNFNVSDNESIALLESLVEMVVEIVSLRLEDTQDSILNFMENDFPNQQVYATGKQILEVLFGGPTFIFPAIETNLEFQTAADNRMALIPSEESPLLEVWMHANAMIRKPLLSLLELRSMGDILLSQLEDSNRPIDCQPVQYPFAIGDRWCGLPNVDDSNLQELISGKQNVVFTNAELLSGNTLVSGFKLDDWQEIIPDSEVTSGIAIHKNQPLAESPQAIMIAVPTDNVPTWKWGINDVAHSVLQAIDMAKYRTVEPEQVTLAINDLELNDLLSPMPDLRKHLAKIFPANMVEAYPAADSNTTNNGIGGNRVSMDYSTNN